MSDTAFRPLPLVLPKADFMHLQELSTRLKTIREPVRELARVATAGGSSTADTAVPVGDPAVSAVLLARLRDQLDITQRLMHEYLASICGDKAVLSRRPNSSGRVSLNRGPGSGDRKSINRISTSSTSTTRSRSDTQDSNGMPSGRAARPQSLYVAATDRGASAVPEALVAVPLPASVKTEAGRKPTSADAQSSAGPTAAMQRTASLTRPLVPVNTIENAIARMWRCGNGLALAPARAVNEIGVRLGQRHMTPLEERIPSIPSRALAGNAGAAPIDIVDLVNSLFRSSMCENEASLLTKRIETIPPGVVACAIANSSSQLFEQLTADLISRYATASDDATGAHSVLRMLSDHANFLTRLVETTIAYPIHAAQRARRIEWWTAVVCLIRELGDYESLSSLVCVFSGAVVGRLHDTWELVSPQCKAAIRFILDTVLKIHPNYASYRDELRQRIKRQEALKRALAASQNKAAISAALGVSTNTTALEESSLDFDSAIAIATPDLCATDESYVNSCLFCKEAFELPPPRVLVPIVAVLLKDAVSAEAASSDKSTNRRSMRRKQTDPPMHWSTVMKHCRNTSLPLSLDYFMLRRIFATELSALPMLASAPGNSETQGPQARNSQPLSVGQGLLARGAMSTASSFLRRMPRRHSATSKDSAATEELSMANCRMLGAGQNVPTIVDILAHFLYIAAGNSCFSCSMGSLLEPLHVSTSAQLAIVVTSMMVFSEPWMPREYLMRLCDLREPRPQPSIQSASSFKSPPLPGASSDAVRGSRGAHSQGYESRSSERPWLMSFKLTDSAESARYFKFKANPAEKEPSLEAEMRKTSTDSDTTCVNGPQQFQPGAAMDSWPPRASAAARSNHRRSLSSHAAPQSSTPNPFIPLTTQNSKAVPDMPPLPTYSHQQQQQQVPPLPAAEMPTWVPSNTSRSPPPTTSRSPPTSFARSPPWVPSQIHERWLPSSTNAPPPLPSQPMPRSQPSGKSISPPPPPSLPLPNKRISTAVSPETQMLLSFDSRSRRR